jgi:plasmid stabilization system protein ParE
VDELPPQLREWIIEFGQGAYVILYHYDGKQVVILAVRHGREAGYRFLAKRDACEFPGGTI